MYHFQYERKSPKIILNLQLWDFFHGTQERVRNSRGKRAIRVRATEDLLWRLIVVEIESTLSYQDHVL